MSSVAQCLLGRCTKLKHLFSPLDFRSHPPLRSRLGNHGRQQTLEEFKRPFRSWEPTLRLLNQPQPGHPDLPNLNARYVPACA